MIFQTLIFWVLIIGAVVFAVRYFNRQNHAILTQGKKSTALEILKERYAKGEIDKEEYEAKKVDLTS